MTIRDYCLDHKCSNEECLFKNACLFYMCGGTPPSDMTFEEAADLTQEIIKLGKTLESENEQINL